MQRFPEAGKYVGPKLKQEIGTRPRDCGDSTGWPLELQDGARTGSGVIGEKQGHLGRRIVPSAN